MSTSFNAAKFTQDLIASKLRGLVRRGVVSASTGLTNTTVTIAGESYTVSAAVVPYAATDTPATNDEVIILHTPGGDILLGKVHR